MSQLCLEIASSSPEVEQPVLSVERVPRNLAIAPQRYYLTIEQGKLQWCYPLQLLELESRWLLAKVKAAKLNLTLTEEGRPVDAESLHAVVEFLIERRMSRGGSDR